MADSQPDLGLVLGDLSYGASDGEQAWCNFVTKNYGSGPLALLAGNHESNGLNGDIDDFVKCLPNQLPGVTGRYGKQYYVDVPADQPLVRFVMISPGLDFGTAAKPDVWKYKAGDAHYTWTSEAIDGARAKGVPWVVVGMHKPCLSLGQYWCTSGSSPAGADITNLLLKKKVDLVLHGHEHLYQRTKQLRTGVTSCQQLAVGKYDSGCVVDSDSTLSKGAGTVFTTVGTGGHSSRRVHLTDPEKGYFKAWSPPDQPVSHGFLDIAVTHDKLTAAFVPTSGQFTDSFTISRTRYVADGFTRTVTGGWGKVAADGAYTYSGARAAFAVTGTAGTINSPRGVHLQVRPPATATHTDLRAVVALNAMPKGTGFYLRLDHRVSSGGYYDAKMRVAPTGVVSVGIQRVSASGSVTWLRRYTPVPGLRYAAGKRLNVRTILTGTKPTRITVKVWAAGTREPSAWTARATDATPALQRSGRLRLDSYLSRVSSQRSVRLAVDNLVVDRA